MFNVKSKNFYYVLSDRGNQSFYQEFYYDDGNFTNHFHRPNDLPAVIGNSGIQKWFNEGHCYQTNADEIRR